MASKIGYKLTTQQLTTHEGFQWTIGEWKRATGLSNKPCTDGVLHYYTHPLVASLMNPKHANIQNPVCFKIKVAEAIGTDGLKSWCKAQMLCTVVEFPIISIAARVRIAILCSLRTPESKEYELWANNWLTGKDRSSIAAAAHTASADAAAYAAYAAYAAAAVHDAAVHDAAADTAAAYAADAMLLTARFELRMELDSADADKQKLNKWLIATIKRSIAIEARMEVLAEASTAKGE